MTNRQANGAKLPKLTAGQINALQWCELNDLHHPFVGHGIYRSLVIRGYLRPCRGGYELTPEGKALVARIVVET